MKFSCRYVAVLFAAVAGLAWGQGAPHGPDGYRNNYPHAGRESFWAWQWDRIRDGLPKSPPEGWNLPAVRTDAAALRTPETNPSVTWAGHATMLVRLAGMAFIPIGAYAPRWFMKVMHVDVPEAVQIRADLNAARAIGMHWGTFEALSDEPLDEPPAVLARQRRERGLSPVDFDVLKIGETRRLDKAAAFSPP